MVLRVLLLLVALATIADADRTYAQDIPSFRQATAQDLHARVPLIVPILVSNDSTRDKIAVRMILLAGHSYIAIFSSISQLSNTARSLNPTDQMMLIDRGALCENAGPQTLFVLDIGSSDSLVTNGTFFCETFSKDRDRIRRLRQNDQSVPNPPMQPTAGSGG